MRSTEKNRKQRSTYLPISIKLVLKLALLGLGISVWGTGFVWAVAGLYFFYPVIRGILTFVVGSVAIIAFIFFLMTFL